MYVCVCVFVCLCVCVCVVCLCVCMCCVFVCVCGYRFSIFAYKSLDHIDLFYFKLDCLITVTNISWWSKKVKLTKGDYIYPKMPLWDWLLELIVIVLTTWYSGLPEASYLGSLGFAECRKVFRTKVVSSKVGHWAHI
jgi:hypothetical protein